MTADDTVPDADAQALGALVAGHIRDVPDFPTHGILFRDIMPLLADGPAFAAAIDGLIAHHGPDGFDVVVGIEARGFLLAAAIAYATGVGVIPVRKAGKLPPHTVSTAYTLEYGEAVIEMHANTLHPAQRVLVVDDVLATGGTLEATLRLLEQVGAEVAGVSVILELADLGGRERIRPYTVQALLTV